MFPACPTNKKYRSLLIALFIVAVLVRLFLIYEYDPGLRNDTIGNKGPNFVPLSYRTLAMAFFNGDLSTDVGARSPGYPALMAASFFLFGVDNYEAIVWIQLLMGIAIFIASYWLWSQLYGAGMAAIIATATTTLEPALILAEDQVLSETLTVMLLVLSLALIVNTVRRDRLRVLTAVLSGICVAWLALTRPAFQLIIPLYALYIVVVLREKWRNPAVLLALVAFLGVSVLPVLGWNAYNYHRFGYFTMMTTQGYILSTHTVPLIAGEPERYGEYADIANIVDHYNETSQGQSIWLAYPEIMQKRQVSFVEGSRLMQNLSYEIIKDHPFGYARSVFHAVSNFWEGRLDPLGELDNSVVFKLISAIYDFVHKLGVAVFFAVIAMDLIRPRRWLEPIVIERMLMLGVIVLVCLSSTIPIAFDNGRYKIPLHPLIWGIAASSITLNWRGFRNLLEKWR